MSTTLLHAPEDDRTLLESTLVGRRIVSADFATAKSSDWAPSLRSGLLTLDDGTKVEFIGHDGGCACSAGCYDLVHLGSVDNVITAVHFEDCPAGDDYDAWDGYYSIFVVADNERINLARFEGTDGNGYYGTGYYIRITRTTGV